MPRRRLRGTLSRWAAANTLESQTTRIVSPLGCGRTDGYVGPDLRWTAKTLITHAGVRPDIPERVLAHVIPRVEGIYDRWGYLPEKHDALTRLATLVDRIINPPADNIVRRAPAKRRHDTPLNPSGAG